VEHEKKLICNFNFQASVACVANRCTPVRCHTGATRQQQRIAEAKTSSAHNDKCFIANMSQASAEESAGSAKKRLPNITDEERSLMQKWLQKEHHGHKHLNARWIKGGGGCGAGGMVDSKAVKTSGAYEALAKYVNEHLQSKPQPGDDAFWTKAVACTRFTSAFKQYGEACKIGSKSDSAIGASEDQVNEQINFDAVVLAQRVKKCPMFLVFHALYQEHPSIHPVINVGMREEDARQGDIEQQDLSDGQAGVTGELQHGEGAGQQHDQTNSSSSNKSIAALGKVKSENKPTFRLKEGAKKVDFTTQWAQTMGEAKAARLEFEKQKDAREQESRKRELEERAADREAATKRAKSELLIQLLQRGLPDNQIQNYMRLCGYSIADKENFQDH
jgi:hypothetical protein